MNRMLTDAEIPIAIADLDPEHEDCATWHGYAEIVYRDNHQLREQIRRHDEAETAIARRRVRRREWALWIAAGVLVAAAVWRFQ